MKQELSSSPPLDRPASIPALRRLLAADALTSGEVDVFEERVRRSLPWQSWLDRGLLSLGVVLILAGIGYFFAHNWQHLTDADKLGLAAGAVFVSLAGGTWAGLDRFPGKLLLLAAGVLVGMFIAVFGQVYQTGADSYELFTGWAFLIFPWVALGRFMPLWIFWIGLLNFALGLYWPVAPFAVPFESLNLFRHQTISLVLLNGLALLAREVVERWRYPWFDRGWSAILLLAATMVPASVETIAEILHTWDGDASRGTSFLACAIFAAFVIGLGFYYSRMRYSLPSLALVTLGTCTVLTFLVIRVLNFDRANLGSGTWLVAGLIVLSIFGTGVYFLRVQRLSHQHV
jgi:uncharacterized membrane protein